MVALLLLIGAGYDLVRAHAPRTRRSAPPPGANAAIDTTLAPDAPAAGAPLAAAVTPAAGARLDLNRASAAELDALPGIGPVLAARIVEHRRRHGPFRRADDLLAVPGIGPALFARLEPRVTVGPPPAP